MVFLVTSGFAQQSDVAQALGRSVRTIRRYQERYARGEMSNRAIAHRLGVTEKAIRKLAGPSKPAESAQLVLPAITTEAEKPAASGVPSATPSGVDEAGTMES